MKELKKVDINMSMKITEALREILKDQELTAAACYTGISKMLKTAWFPILPRILIEKGISPNDWFEGAYRSSLHLSALLVERFFKIDLKNGVEKIRIRGFPCEKYEYEKKIPDYVKEILRWDIIEVPMLRELGLIWYVDVLLDESRASEEQRIEEMIEATNILNVDLDKLESDVLSFARDLEKQSTIRIANEEQPVIRWSHVFRCP